MIPNAYKTYPPYPPYIIGDPGIWVVTDCNHCRSGGYTPKRYAAENSQNKAVFPKAPQVPNIPRYSRECGYSEYIGIEKNCASRFGW